MAHIVNSSNNVEFDIDVEELTPEDPRTSTPNGAKITLKPHQQTLLARCIEYENSSISLKRFSELSDHVDEQDCFKTNMAILGDRVGSGKSYVILSLIVSNDITLKNHTIIKSHGFNKVIYYIHDKTKSIKTNLLVVPHNLSIQWEEYIKKFGGNIRYKVIKTQKVLDELLHQATHIHVDTNNDDSNGSSSDTNESTSSINIQPISETRPQCEEVLSQYDLIVITSTLYNRFAQFLYVNQVKLQRVIYDEVDNLNVPGCKHVEANFLWFVTASYGNLIYPKGYNRYESSIGRYVWYASGIKHSGFLKNLLMDLFYNVSRNLMKVLVIKNREAYVESSLSLPDINSYHVLCKTPYEINILNGIVDRNILNFLNADDIQGALSYINPSHKSNETNIIAKVVEKYTRQLTNINIQINTTREYLYDTELERQVELSRLHKQLDTINEKIKLITLRIKENDLCTICYENVVNKTVTSCCQNTFCFKCINLWLLQKHLCPLCKVAMNVNDLYVIDNNIVDTQASCSSDEEQDDVLDPTKPNKKNDKYQNLEVILKNLKPNAKILLFSAYDNTFYNVVPILRNLRISFEYLKGNGNQINCCLERYKNGTTKVLLVNSRAFGSGLNLENTSDIIMFHKFDTEIEKQVIGRAHRLGRSEPLNVYYLLYENEMSLSN